ncbi:MAG: bifunctional riboflavin kinase/FAD synthetase [Gammaproteobacteria bacterium]
MELIRGLYNLRAAPGGCVATIGNFDGVHLGHQAVLTKLAARAADGQLPSVTIIFEPLPREFLHPPSAPARLTRLREKLMVLREHGIDSVLCLRFDAALAAMTATEFIDRILIQGLGIRYLVLGDDFHFGKNREGNFDTLRAAGSAYGFEVASMPTFQVEGERVSSTRIRQALKRGDMRTAEALLGRHYCLCGRVRRGDALGRTLGFPTANLALGWPLPPVHGIYAVDVFGLEREPLPGAASIGSRPAVNGTEYRLEVYLLDFNEDIYGRHLRVELLRKIRDEAHFDSLDALKTQIASDVAATRQFFNRR